MKPGQQGEHHEHHHDAGRGLRQRWATGDAAAAAAEAARALERLCALDEMAAARDAVAQRRMVKAAEVLILVAVLMAGFSAFSAYAEPPKPTYAQARKITDAVQTSVGATGVWHQKPDGFRAQAGREAIALDISARKLFGDDPFGPYGQCLNMTNMHVEYVQSMTRYVMVLQGRSKLSSEVEILNPLRSAFSLGEAYRICRDTVEKLDAKK